MTAAVSSRLGIRAQVAYLELCEPLLPSVLASCEEPTVVVPLLLSTGYHVRIDLPHAVAAAPGRVALAAPLGSDPLLAAARAERLRAAGAYPGQPVVMVAAGSRDLATAPQLHRAAVLLGRIWGGPVRLATLSGPAPRLEDVR